MDYFERIYGNETIKRMFENEVRAGTLSHAFIIEGASGSGRRTLVRSVLRALSGGEYDEKIEKGISPDIFYISVPEGKSVITVDQIRALREEAYFCPHELSFKAFVICEAHRMNEAAQNALLKVLEDPPGPVYFFLLCESGNRLLPTVCSRAPIVRMQSFSQEQISDFLIEHSAKARKLKEQSPEEFSFLLRSSNGSIGAALAALDGEAGDAAKIYKSVRDFLDILRASDKSALILYEDRIPDTREGFSAFVEGVASAFRDILAIKKGFSGSLLFFRSAEEAEDCCFAFSEKKVVKGVQFCLELLAQTEFHINLKMARIKLLDGLWR